MRYLILVIMALGFGCQKSTTTSSNAQVDESAIGYIMKKVDPNCDSRDPMYIQTSHLDKADNNYIDFQNQVEKAWWATAYKAGNSLDAMEVIPKDEAFNYVIAIPRLDQNTFYFRWDCKYEIESTTPDLNI